jgi:hypothetical protein
MSWADKLAKRYRVTDGKDFQLNAAAVVDTLESLNLSYPKVDAGKT